jgi:tryptophan synthase alpha chain
MSKIQATFAALQAQGKKGLIPFITAGDPHPRYTVDYLHALVRGGADVIELGIPFSDPMADGPVVQRASERALAHQVSVLDVLQMVATFRETNQTTPIVLMGYANPIEHMGVDVFIARAVAAGVDGVLVVDYPPEESVAFAKACREHGLDAIFLIAPTTTEARIAQIAALATGYIYYVSLKGITGAGHLDIGAVADKMPVIQKYTQVPIGVGFGIRDADTAQKIGQVADAVVIGSRLIQVLEQHPNEAGSDALEAFLGTIRAALDAHLQGHIV